MRAGQDDLDHQIPTDHLPNSLSVCNNRTGKNGKMHIGLTNVDISPHLVCIENNTVGEGGTQELGNLLQTKLQILQEENKALQLQQGSKSRERSPTS